MQFTIGQDKKDLHISTVSLVSLANDVISLFRCPMCGTAISQYTGMVTKIYPNLEPTLDMLVISKCHECGALYTFQTMFYGQKKLSRVILFCDPFSTSNTFHCYTCRKPLLKYTHELVVDVSTIKQVTLPYHLKCPTPECPSDYDFADVV